MLRKDFILINYSASTSISFKTRKKQVATRKLEYVDDPVIKVEVVGTSGNSRCGHNWLKLAAETGKGWKQKYFEQFESELLMSLTIFGGYAHACVSKSRFITFKVKEDVCAVLGGTCTYKQEPSFEADSR